MSGTLSIIIFPKAKKRTQTNHHNYFYQFSSFQEKFATCIRKARFFVFRFYGHHISKNATMSTGCHPIMDQTVLQKSLRAYKFMQSASVPDAVCHPWPLPRAKKVSTGHFFTEVLQLPPPSSSHFSITKKRTPSDWMVFFFWYEWG